VWKWIARVSDSGGSISSPLCWVLVSPYGKVMTQLCEIIYVAAWSDQGLPCGKTAVAKCSDCGTAICSDCCTECCGDSFCGQCYDSVCLTGVCRLRQ
jgi:hypothetical protein